LNPTAQPTEDTYYTLTVTNSNGCQASDKVFIKVLQRPEISNTFTPNGDGVNDTWNIKYLDSYSSSTIKIFNRYGKEVFKADKYTEPWDGKLNGIELPEGTYYYIITANNGTLKYTGSVLLLR
jgi:gliding motility-associated-like protein